MDLTKLIGVNSPKAENISEQEVDEIFDRTEQYAEKITQLDSKEHRDLGFACVCYYLEKINLKYFFIDLIDRIEMSVLSQEKISYDIIGKKLYDVISTSKLWSTERVLFISLYNELEPLGAFTKEDKRNILRITTPKELRG